MTAMMPPDGVRKLALMCANAVVQVGDRSPVLCSDRQFKAVLEVLNNNLATLAPDERTLPELPSTLSRLEITHEPNWDDDKQKFVGKHYRCWIITRTDHEGRLYGAGSTPRAAVLAALARITPMEEIK